VREDPYEPHNKGGNKGATGPGKGSTTRNQRQNPYVPVKKDNWKPPTETLRRAMMNRLMRSGPQ